MGVPSTGATTPVGMEPLSVGVYRWANSRTRWSSTPPLACPDRLK